MAAEICGAPVGLINFVGDRQQFFKANVGRPGHAAFPLGVGFCPVVVRDRKMLVIPDALADPEHAGNAAVINGGVRFYAGVPLMTSDAHVLGTLCVIDTAARPSAISARERRSLEA